LLGFIWFASDEFARGLNPGLQRGPVGNGLGCLSGPRYPYPGKLRVVEKAALADLLVVNGDPITDIALLEKPDTNLAMIMKGGRIYKDVPKDRRPRLQPKSAFSCIPPVHRADLKGQQRVDSGCLTGRLAGTKRKICTTSESVQSVRIFTARNTC
jgi:hypothetical protein